MKVINKIKLKLLVLFAGLLSPLFACADWIWKPEWGLLFPIYVPNWWESTKSGAVEAVKDSILGGLIFLLEMVFMFACKCVNWAGLVLDFAIEFSITKSSSIYTSAIVRSGWELCRDMTNFIFIFALIFIAIATILQVQSYGFKRLLVGIILAALLVNFSATITMVVVDASNLVATEFLCAATAGTCDPRVVSAIISNALKFQTIIANKDGTVTAQDLNIGKQALVYLFGTGLGILVVFVFLAGAFMFITRAFIIMFLLIFAPFAFVGTALKMSSAKRWWTKLFNQAIIAPVYFFLFYLVISNLDWAESIVNTKNDSFIEMVTRKETDSVVMITNFIVMGGLLFGILIVSQQLGAMGSAGAMRMLKSGAGRVSGYVGKAPRKAVGLATGAVGAGAVAGAAAVARKMNLSTRIAPTTSRKAWMQEKLQGLERGGTKKGQEKTKKQVERGLGLAPKDQSEYIKSLNSGAQKDMFSKMSDRQRADMKQQSTTPGFDQIYTKLKKDLSPEEKEKTEKSEATVEKKINIEKLKNTTTTAAELTKLHETLMGDDLKKLVGDATVDGQAAATKYFDSLKTIGGLVNGTVNQIADQLNLMGNKAQASWIKTTASRKILEEEYGIMP